MSENRNGENKFWKLLRLWPLVFSCAAIIGMIYVMSDDIVEAKDTQKIQWSKINDNKSSITELEKQTSIIEYHLNQVDLSMKEQKLDIKEILREVKR